jgi:hypothetical protein
MKNQAMAQHVNGQNIKKRRFEGLVHQKIDPNTQKALTFHLRLGRYLSRMFSDALSRKPPRMKH